jgi:hypothetical protein
MTTTTYVDAVGAARAWINSRTGTLVGGDNPLAKGAHLRYLDGAADKCYAYLSLQTGTGNGGGAETGWMSARISAEITGPTLEAVTRASVQLADELFTYLTGAPARVTLTDGVAQLCVVDEISGPFDYQDGSDLPKHIVDFTLILMPG